eukprot:SAG11_NODE_3084_length_2706_cov_4.251630_5_plen_49_part_00
MSANGCEGADGVNINYSIGITFPNSVWAALNASSDPSVNKLLPPNVRS